MAIPRMKSKELSNKKTHQTEEEKQSPTKKVFLPYIKGITGHMDKVLKKHNLQIVFRPTTKIQQMLWSAKEKRNPLATIGVYRIPCSCGQ
ncbi:hypothetical protein JRQ81_017752, partial [Phrynocephalus forsythii]